MPDLDWLHQPRQNLVTTKPTQLVRFRDINADYGETNEPLLVEEDVAIRKQIRNVLGTPLDSEEFLPGYGSNLPFRIMEPITPINGYLIEGDTIVAIAKWMADRIRIVMPGAFVLPLQDADGYSVVIPYMRLSDKGATVYAFEALR